VSVGTAPRNAEIVIRAVAAADVAMARGLFHRYADALPFDLGYQNFADEMAGLPAPYQPPGGALFLAWRHAEPLGMVGVKPLEPDIAEIKRLFVVPEARGQRIGLSLLRRALDTARRLGYSTARLDTHRQSMAPAIALYRSVGFCEVAPYGPDLGGEIVFFERRLDSGDSNFPG
jgi:putative acetyltransferase